MLIKLQNVTELERLKIACEATGITFKDSKQYGKFTTVQLSVKDAAHLFQLGIVFAEIPSEEELKKQVLAVEIEATKKEEQKSVNNSLDEKPSEQVTGQDKAKAKAK